MCQAACLSTSVGEMGLGESRWSVGVKHHHIACVTKSKPDPCLLRYPRLVPRLSAPSVSVMEAISPNPPLLLSLVFSGFQYNHHCVQPHHSPKRCDQPIMDLKVPNSEPEQTFPFTSVTFSGKQAYLLKVFRGFSLSPGRAPISLTWFA